MLISLVVVFHDVYLYRNTKLYTLIIYNFYKKKDNKTLVTLLINNITVIIKMP